MLMLIFRKRFLRKITKVKKNTVKHLTINRGGVKLNYIIYYFIINVIEKLYIVYIIKNLLN